MLGEDLLPPTPSPASPMVLPIIPAKPARREPPPLAPMEPKLRRRLATGREAIEDRLDLHGMTQAQAHSALAGFVQRAHARDIRIALVITGKGSDFGERGVLRRVVPLWLREPALRALVSSVEEAARPHGGAGAFYVRLRRRRAL
jgi:DNA-nicking Smr family endonuclease